MTAGAIPAQARYSCLSKTRGEKSSVSGEAIYERRAKTACARA
jgi:hypothetical protein